MPWTDAPPPHSWDNHRCALSLADPSTPRFDATSAARWVDGPASARNLDFLRHHGLAAWWAETLASNLHNGTVSDAVAEALSDSRRTAAAHYLIQSAALSQITTALEREHIMYAVLKGAAIREEAYRTPALRTAGDIDILISPTSTAAATACLRKLGFVTSTSNSPHEVTYSRGRVDIDLHWDILRPGRTRNPMVGALLARSVHGPKFRRLSDVDTVFLMLVHPAITKYVCSPHMGLNRVLDFLLFTQSHAIPWADVARRLDEAGLKTAGWCTLRWIQLLAPDAVTPLASFMTVIQPGKCRAAYLNFWVVHDLPGRLLDRANWLIQAIFTLPMHDKFSDAWQALRARAVPESSPRTPDAASL